MPGWVCRPMVTPGSISISTTIVTYPGVGPSVCDRTFRVTPGVVAGGVWAEASVAINPVSEQRAQDATRSLAVVRAGILSAREGRRVEIAEVMEKD